MAKKNKISQDSNVKAAEQPQKKNKKELKEQGKVQMQKKQKPKAQDKQKRSRTKETMSELKKVSWPSFGKTMKQTGMVISVVLIFVLLIIGIDQLLIWLLSLVS